MTERTVLCVDDEPNILQALKRLLRREPYTLLTADDPVAALKLIEAQPVHVVISDQRMPGMSGTELLRKAKEVRPHAVRVILSGYADVDAIAEAINQGQISRFLAKPWHDEDLKLTVRQCIEQYDLAEYNRRLSEQIKTRNEELNGVNERLEETVAERTRVLDLTQEIIDKLPMPIVGIGAEGLIVFANKAVWHIASSLGEIAVGDDMREVLPPPIAEQVEPCLRGVGARCGILPDGDGRDLCFHVEPLDAEDSLRGCLVFFYGRGNFPWLVAE